MTAQTAQDVRVDSLRSSAWGLAGVVLVFAVWVLIRETPRPPEPASYVFLR